jgi:hypothetical protein
VFFEVSPVARFHAPGGRMSCDSLPGCLATRWPLRVRILSEGLMIYGGVILPFYDKFPKDTELYRIMTTKIQEIAAKEGQHGA